MTLSGRWKRASRRTGFKMNCHCGRPLHYIDPKIQEMVQRYVNELGEFMPVTVGHRTWMVQRHFVALHGLKAKDLPFLGFQEVLTNPQRAETPVQRETETSGGEGL
jgi:hypothetical protein